MSSHSSRARLTRSSDTGPKRSSAEAVAHQAMKRITLACVAAGLVVLSVAAILWLGKAERIAVAVTGQTLTAAVGAQAAQSPFLLLFDRKGTLVQAIENPYKNQPGGGISLVDFLSGKGVTALVAEAFGPRILDIMKSKGIRPVEFKGVAADAVRGALQRR
jgi:predicted Fe-Mo cluster-binding NifX family protein